MPKPPQKSTPSGAARRSIALLSAAAFVATASLRVADPLLPQFAHEFGVSLGTASTVVTSSAMAYAVAQTFYGPVGDRFGKYRVVAITAFCSAISVAAAALSPGLVSLALLRLLAGTTAAAIIPLSMAYIGDVVPFESRQPVLARFMSGQILGILFGQAVGGMFADTLGWRAMFALLGALFMAIALLLWGELRSPRVPPSPPVKVSWRGLPQRYFGLVGVPGVPRIFLTVTVEGCPFFGGFTFLGAYLRHRFDLPYSAVGGILACFGIGGLVYSLTAPAVVRRLPEPQNVYVGGALLAISFAAFALLPAWWMLPPFVAIVGFGFYVVHNTLQNHATQMAPHERGTALSVFAALFYLGQAIGVGACGLMVDQLGYRPMFLGIGCGLLALAVLFGRTGR